MKFIFSIKLETNILQAEYELGRIDKLAYGLKKRGINVTNNRYNKSIDDFKKMRNKIDLEDSFLYRCTRRSYNVEFVVMYNNKIYLKEYVDEYRGLLYDVDIIIRLDRLDDIDNEQMRLELSKNSSVKIQKISSMLGLLSSCSWLKLENGVQIALENNNMMHIKHTRKI